MFKTNQKYKEKLDLQLINNRFKQDLTQRKIIPKSYNF